MKMNKDRALLGAAVAGMIGASFTLGMGGAGRALADDAAPAAKPAKGSVHCFGVNSCGGKGACATASNDCSGKNSCKGKGWMAMSKKECKAKGGHVEHNKKKTDAAKS